MMITAIAVAIAITASSQTPIPRPDSYDKPGMATWGVRAVMTAANTAYPIYITGTTPACFAHRSVVVIRAMGGEAACTWSDDAGATTFAGNVDSANACVVNDAAGYDGPGACFALSSAERIDQSPWLMPYRMPGSRRTGQCNATTTAPGGAIVYVPCDADADCTTAGSGTTCTIPLGGAETRNAAQAGCSFLVCQGDTAGMYVFVGVEQ